MRKLLIQPQARVDLLEIWLYMPPIVSKPRTKWLASSIKRSAVWWKCPARAIAGPMSGIRRFDSGQSIRT